MEPEISSEIPIENKKEEEEYGEFTVGITEYLAQGEEIKGSIKYRFLDFIVNEIDLQGNVIYTKKPEVDEKKPIEHKKKKEEKFELSEENKLALVEIIGKENLEKVELYLEELESGDKNKPMSIEIPSPDDKGKRKEIHEIIKKHLSIFDSETLEKDSVKFIRISHSGNNKRRRFYKKTEDQQLEFVLNKTNFDTLSAINYIGKMLHKPTSFFGIAGTKDKRGVTTQRVTVFNTTIEEISALQKFKNWNKSVILSDFRIVKEKLRIGSLFGNKFSLAIRFVDSPIENLRKNIDNLKNKGFINYFGMQRFGSSNVHTHMIGLNIMKRNWKETVEMILGQIDQDDFIFKIKKEFLQTNNYSLFLKKMPIKFKIERSLVEGLKRSQGTDYLRALLNLPRNTRNLYVHAYQSYIWNRAASSRIKNYGDKPVIGDMVIDKQAEESMLIPKENEEEKTIEEEKLNESIEEVDFVNEFEIKNIKILDETNIQNYKLDDVIIPLVGSDYEIPEKCIVKKVIFELLEEDGMTLDLFAKTSKEFFVSGAFRYLISKPRELKWNIAKFDDPNQDLLDPFDLAFKDTENDINEKFKEGRFQALCLNFTLRKSEYATMCMRELMKITSSHKNQLDFNKYVDGLVKSFKAEKTE